MTTDGMADFIARNGITAEVVRPAADTSTVETAAAAVGVETDRIVKSLVFLADGQPVLVLACGTGKVNAKKVADYLGLSRKRVKMASAEYVLAETGFAVGVTPPFGHKSRLRALIDERVLAQPEVYAAAGSPDILIRMSPGELARVTEAEKVSVVGE